MAMRETQWSLLLGEIPIQPVTIMKTKIKEGRGVERWVTPVMVTKEGRDYMELWMSHTNDGSCNTTSKTNEVLNGD